jgi:hypothetical protein
VSVTSTYVIHLEEGKWAIFKNRLRPGMPDRCFYVVSHSSKKHSASLINIADLSLWQYTPVTSTGVFHAEGSDYSFMSRRMKICYWDVSSIITRYGEDKVHAVYQAVEKKHPSLNQK